MSSPPKITAIAYDATALNLALTGIRVEEASDVKDVESRMDELLQDGAGVLILDERYRDEFSDRMQERLRRHKGDPLIVYCPTFEEADADVDAYLSSVIKPAVGFEIRLA